MNVNYVVPEGVNGGGLRKESVVGEAELEISTPHGQDLPWEGFANTDDISTDSGSEQCFLKIEK